MRKSQNVERDIKRFRNRLKRIERERFKRSNCLFQAAFHYLVGCNIFYVKPREKDGFPHFVWHDKKLGCYRHFTYIEKKKNWWQLIWYKGYIDNFPYDRMRIELVPLFHGK